MLVETRFVKPTRDNSETELFRNPLCGDFCTDKRMGHVVDRSPRMDAIDDNMHFVMTPIRPRPDTVFRLVMDDDQCLMIAEAKRGQDFMRGLVLSRYVDILVFRPRDDDVGYRIDDTGVPRCNKVHFTRGSGKLDQVAGGDMLRFDLLRRAEYVPNQARKAAGQ